MINIYLAGPLFSRGEVRDRLDDERKLKKAFGKRINIYSPYKYNLICWRDKRKQNFFEKDLEEMEKADIAIIDLDNYDPGTIAELGWFYRDGAMIYGIYSNWKYPMNEGIMNTFIKGLLNGRVYKSIEEVIKQLKKELKTW